MSEDVGPGGPPPPARHRRKPRADRRLVIAVIAAAVVAAVFSGIMTMVGDDDDPEPLRTRQAPPIFSLPPKPANPESSRSSNAISPDTTGPATVGDFVIGATVNLEVQGGTGERLRLRNFLTEPDSVSAQSSEFDRAQFRFLVRRSLSSANCVSLEADSYRGFYLRQQGFVLGIGPRDGTYSDEDATLCPVPAPDGGFFVRLPDYPDRYLTVRDGGVHLDDIDPAQATSFEVRTAL